VAEEERTQEMKDVRVKVRLHICEDDYDYGIYKGKKRLMDNVRRKYGTWTWESKSVAIRAAKAMAERIGIPYSDELIETHGC